MERSNRNRFDFAITNLKNMLDNKIYTDCVLECVGGNIKAHRCILMASNPFFYRVFTNYRLEDTLIHIEFENVSIDILSLVINCMYGQRPPDLKSNYTQLVKVMDFCQLIEEKYLLEYYMKKLTDFMTLDNCFEMWSQVMQFNQKDAEECIMSFVLDNSIQTLLSAKIITISEYQLHELVSFANKTCKCNDELLQVIIKWGKDMPKERLKYCIDFIKVMDKSNISACYIKQAIESDSYVRSSQELYRIFERMNERFKKVVATVSCERNVQLQFYSLGESGAKDRIFTQKYDIKKKKWSAGKTIRLPPSPSMWYPMISDTGDQFFFSISNERTFIAYCETNHELHIGPGITYETKLTGVVDNQDMYLWNYESVVVFNSTTKVWKVLTPIRTVLSPNNLLAINEKLYFHAAFPPTICKYNFPKNEWELKCVFQERSNIRSIKCKCYRDNCKGKLYFVANNNQLMSFNTETEIWDVIILPELQSIVPLFMSCDEPFILFANSRIIKNFYLYYPLTDTWETFQSEICCKDVDLICDLLIK